MESISSISDVLGSTHALTLDAARDASSFRKSQANASLREPQLRKLLDSRHDREVLEGLRRVIAMSHRPPLPTEPLLFSSVLKNIASPNPHIKKLVYIHLLQHAESDPDTALLSINTIQKTLSSSDPHLRALALRVMSSIRVPVISQIVLLAIKKGCADMSPLVRKAAALAVPKCYRLDPSTGPQLEEFLSQLLGDKQYFVVGAAVVAFMEVCGWARLELVHEHYRSLVRKLVDMDEWGQVATLRLMVGYGRRCLPWRWRKAKRKSASQTGTKSFYDEDDDEETNAADSTADEAESQPVPELDPDLTLLLNAAAPLLQSRNSAVVIAVTRLYLALAPTPPHNTSYLTMTVGPLISLMRCAPSIAATALYSTIQVALQLPQPFLRYASHFLLRRADSPDTARLKLEMQTVLFPHAGARLQSLILSELAHFCGAATSPALVRDVVRAIGRCAQAAAPGSAAARRCLALLLAQVDSYSESLVGEALTVIRHLVQADPAAHFDTVTRLAKNLDTLRNAQARASVVWLVGEFVAGRHGNGRGNIAADVLRILAKGFADEEEVVRMQIGLLAAKVYLHWLNGEAHEQEEKTSLQSYSNKGEDGLIAETETNVSSTSELELPEDNGWNDKSPTTNDVDPVKDERLTPEAALNTPSTHPIAQIYDYVLLLSRYDTSYSLRDRARLYRSILSTPTSTQLANLLLLVPKPVPSVPSPSESRQGLMLGSASLVIGTERAGLNGLKGYEAVPEWIAEGKEPNASVRDEGDIGGGYETQKWPQSASSILDAKAATVGRGQTVSQNPVAAPVGEKSLDDWLAEDEKVSEEDEEDSVESESESEEDEEELEDEADEEESNDEEEEKGKLIGK